MMIKANSRTVQILATLAAIGFSSAAAAQATRTWVSGVGDDANPCSRTAPCKTFAGAIAKTATTGEINCIDPGGFGAVTIIKSITIDCTGTNASILAAGTNAIIVNDTTGAAKVVIRGLSLQGASSGSTGVRFLAGASLLLENISIREFNTTAATGVLISPTTAAVVTINDVTITDNGAPAAGGGVIVQPQGAAALKVFLNNVRVTNNGNVGVQINTAAGTGTVNLLELHNSVVSHNGNGVAVVSPPSTAQGLMTVDGTPVTYNTGYGIGANGSSAQVRVTRSTIAGNAYGLRLANSGAIVSYGDNVLFGSFTADGSFSATLPKQ